MSNHLTTSELLVNAVKEGIAKQRNELITQAVTGHEILKLVTLVPDVETSLESLTVDTQGEMIVDYVDADNQERSGNIVLGKKKVDLVKRKLHFHFDPHAPIFDRYKAYLKSKGIKAEGMTLAMYLFVEAEILKRSAAEIAKAAFNGKYVANHTGKRTIMQKMDGWIEQAIQSVQAGTGAQVIPTGVLQRATLSDQMEGLYELIPSGLKDEPLVMVMTDTQDDRFDSNYGKIYNGRALKSYNYAGTSVTGHVFPLGGQRHSTLPVPFLDAPNGVMITPLSNMEVYTNVELAGQTIKCMEIDVFKTAIGMVFPINVGFKDLRKVILNDKAATRS